MKTRPIFTLTVITALLLRQSIVPVFAQAKVLALPVKKIDNAILLEAYKQSISDVSYGKYVAASFGLLKRLEVQTVEQLDDPDVVDQWTQVMSCMTGLPTFNKAKGADFNVPQVQIDTLKRTSGIDAIQEIVKRAAETRIVILNENHLDPRGRAFGLEVARALKPLGYTILAAEAFRPYADDEEARRKMEQLVADGIVRAAGDFYSGYYLNDPVFADFIRQSLALGYRPVSYETAVRGYTAQEREEAQGDNLIRRAVEAFPNCKILVFVGERHAAENPMANETEPYLKMAAVLKMRTGIDPLTIDQAGLSAVPMNRPDVDLYAIVKQKATKQSIVLFKEDKPFTTGLLAGAVDLQVVHPPTKLVHGRPDWLSKMNRHLAAVPKALLPTSGIRLVQAFVEGSPADARPIDQVLIKVGEKAPYLLLPNVKVRYATQDFNE